MINVATAAQKRLVLSLLNILFKRNIIKVGTASSLSDG